MMPRKSPLILVATGDVSPNREDPPSIFRHCGDVFRSADIVFGQMESPLSDRGTPMFIPGSPCKLPAKNVEALTEKGAGFDVMSFACNHAMDFGWEAFLDTLKLLRENGISVVGAGENIAEARRAAIIERKGTKVGFLAYLSIVSPGLVADEDIPGCAPLRASHSYQQMDFQPGTPPLIVTKLIPEDRLSMEESIRKLRPQVDVLVVSMHCGVHFVPSVIAMYQKEAAYAAVDAGADLVLQHHAHILKGIEMYKGKAIFYSLGNFALEHTLPFPGKLKPWDLGYRSLREFYHVKVEPGYEKHRFQHDALKSMVVKAYIEGKKINKVTYVPAYINSDLEPEVTALTDFRAQEVFDYVKNISEVEDLNVRFSWDSRREVLVSSDQ